MFSRTFLKDTAERAIKAIAVALAPLFAGGTVDLFKVNWEQVVTLGGGAALTSIILSLASYKVGNSGTASVVKDVAYDGYVGKHRAV